MKNHAAKHVLIARNQTKNCCCALSSNEGAYQNLKQSASDWIRKWHFATVASETEWPPRDMCKTLGVPHWKGKIRFWLPRQPEDNQWQFEMHQWAHQKQRISPIVSNKHNSREIHESKGNKYVNKHKRSQFKTRLKSNLLNCSLIWARSCKSVSYAICEQQRCRSACPSAQSDQHLRCLLLK